MEIITSGHNVLQIICRPYPVGGGYWWAGGVDFFGNFCITFLLSAGFCFSNLCANNVYYFLSCSLVMLIILCINNICMYVYIYIYISSCTNLFMFYVYNIFFIIIHFTRGYIYLSPLVQFIIIKKM